MSSSNQKERLYERRLFIWSWAFLQFSPSKKQCAFLWAPFPPLWKRLKKHISKITIENRTPFLSSFFRLFPSVCPPATSVLKQKQYPHAIIRSIITYMMCPASTMGLQNKTHTYHLISHGWFGFPAPSGIIRSV
jgi:hypothetical protein